MANEGVVAGPKAKIGTGPVCRLPGVSVTGVVLLETFSNCSGIAHPLQ